MTSLSRTRGLLLALLVGFVALLGGCGKEDGKQEPKPEKVGKKEHRHDDWWCAEHGIPEDECSMCSKKVERECKAKGDWCDKHDRALSQCFICNPKRKEFYAAKYRAKYGKEPPPIEEELDKKDERK